MEIIQNQTSMRRRTTTTDERNECPRRFSKLRREQREENGDRHRRGLSGLSCGKYPTDLGYSVTVVERANVLGGKVGAWRDKDGDWIETGLHVFFGAYPNAMNLFKELDIEDHCMEETHDVFRDARYSGVTEFCFQRGTGAV